MSATQIRDLVSRHGGDIYNGGLAARIPGPGHSRKDRSLSLTVKSSGRLLWFSHCGDEPEDVWDYLGLKGLGQADRLPRETSAEKHLRQMTERVERGRKLSFCREAWSGTVEIDGTPAETYLRGRAIKGAIPKALRFHPAMPFAYPKPDRPTPRTGPAMVAVVTGPDGRTAVGVHATYILPDGSGKIGSDRAKLMFGDVAGGVIQLGALPASGELAIAEGIETALSYRDLTGTPTWAVMSASIMKRFPLPEGVKRLTVAADSDDKCGAGIEAARYLAGKIRHRCECVIHPPPAGKDWNDVAREAGQ